MRATLGEDHNDTLTIMDNLAVAYVAAGFHDKAIALHEAAIARFNAKLGEDHLTTLVAMNNLARAYQAGGRVDDSIELYEKTLAKLRTKLSDDHPTTLGGDERPGPSYQLAGKLDRSIMLFEATLKGTPSASSGANHPETLQTTSIWRVHTSTAGRAGQGDSAGPGVSRRQPRRIGDRLPADVP